MTLRRLAVAAPPSRKAAALFARDWLDFHLPKAPQHNIAMCQSEFVRAALSDKDLNFRRS